MEIVILLGAPGAGKGTISERVRDDAGCTHVSTGDMLRAAVKQGTEVGKEAESYMKRGELVPDEVMIRIVEQRLDAGREDERYLFDGFPRTTAQAELLEQGVAGRGGRISHVILLEAPREVLVARLTGRRICRQCGRNYHIQNVPPKTPGVCDVCGGELYHRPDDQEETILNRLDVFARQTESLIERYRAKGLLTRIDSSRDAGQVVNEVLQVLGARGSAG